MFYSYFIFKHISCAINDNNEESIEIDGKANCYGFINQGFNTEIPDYSDQPFKYGQIV